MGRQITTKAGFGVIRGGWKKNTSYTFMKLSKTHLEVILRQRKSVIFNLLLGRGHRSHVDDILKCLFEKDVSIYSESLNGKPS